MRDIGHFLGGKAEADETLVEATIREVYEETGFLIEVGDLLAVNEAKLLKRNHHTLFFIFEAQVVGGTKKISMPHEILQIEWVSIEKADQRMPYYAGGIKKLMQGYARYNNQGTM